jgi:hypothetical protein
MSVLDGILEHFAELLLDMESELALYGLVIGFEYGTLRGVVVTALF